MLPGLDGFEILKRLRLTSRVPVLMLTARGEDVDRIVGLELGADDYLPKPFNPRELAARVKAILRRTEARVNRGKVEINGVALDPGTREVTCDGKPVEVTTLEFDILEQLMRNAGRVVSRDGLMESLYNRKATPFDRSIDMHVSHLRRKLESSRPGDQNHSRRGLSVLPKPGRRGGRIESARYAVTICKDAALVPGHHGRRYRAASSSPRPPLSAPPRDAARWACC